MNKSQLIEAVAELGYVKGNNEKVQKIAKRIKTLWESRYCVPGSGEFELQEIGLRMLEGIVEKTVNPFYAYENLWTAAGLFNQMYDENLAVSAA